jgi:hypothetical protein
MKYINNFIFFLIAVLFTSGLFAPPAFAGEIELTVKDLECEEDGNLIIHYSLINSFDFDYPNVTLCFKILEDEKPIICKELKVTVPKGTDGSEINDVVLNLPCTGKKYDLKSMIFYNVKRYKIEEWFSDCK